MEGRYNLPLRHHNAFWCGVALAGGRMLKARFIRDQFVELLHERLEVHECFLIDERLQVADGLGSCADSPLPFADSP
jgi:hypothetical protein